MSKPDSLPTKKARWSIALAMLVTMATLVAMAGLCFVYSPAAVAAPVTFAGPGSGPGQVKDPLGVTVDQSTGTVYVADGENRRVDEFGATGEFQLAFGVGVLDGLEQLETCTVVCQEGLYANGHPYGSGPGESAKTAGVAVDETSHDVYVSTKQARVEKFSSSGGFLLMFGKGVDQGPHHPGDLCTLEYVQAGDTCGEGQLSSGAGDFDSFYMPLAVDAAGNVWVGDLNRVEEFSSAGAFLAEVALPGIGEVKSLALDPQGNLYVVASGFSGVRKFAATGTPIYTVQANEHPNTATIDPGSRKLIVGGGTESERYVFTEYDAESGVETETWGANEVIGTPGSNNGFPEGNGIAAGDGVGRLYALSSKGGQESVAQAFPFPAPGPLVWSTTLLASGVEGTSTTLKATLDSEGKETKYLFEYVDDAQFERDVSEHGAGHGYDHALATPELTLPADFAEHPVSAAIKELLGETGYHFRIRASSECEAGKQCSVSEEATFQTLAPIAVDSVFAENVTGNSVELGTAVNPSGADSFYHFEYLNEAAYQANLQGGGNGFEGASSIPVPDGRLGSGGQDVNVSQLVVGLKPATAYRYRVAAHNVGGERFSAAFAFTTQGQAASGLPDGRAWELVSPPDKHGAALLPVGEAGVIQAAADGGALTYLASNPTEAAPAGYANEVQVLATRGAGGWASRDIALPHEAPTGASVGVGQEYRFFSEDLSRAVVQPFGPFTASLSSEASEQTPYLRTVYTGGDRAAPCMESCYRPLVTGASGVANVPPETKFGVRQRNTNGERCEASLCGPQFVAGTPNLSHVIISSSDVGLTSVEGDEGGLYEWSDGQLALVSVLPNHQPAKRASVPVFGSGGEGTVGARALSADGSRIIWVAGRHLYLRDMTDEQTVELDASQGGSSGGPQQAPFFQTASKDDSRVFFTDGQRLTKDAGASESPLSRDLYECQIVEEAGELKCKLSDLTPSAGEAHSVVGTVLGASEDGSTVYFVADGPGAPGTNPCPATTGPFRADASCDLYVRSSGVTRLVAVLSGQDFADWGAVAGGPTARVSPDGRWMAFMSQRSLTGYDNRDVASGKPDEEVFLYDAEGDGGLGSLVCASCNPSGARPAGREYGTAATLGGGDRAWEPSSWLAANIPTWTPYESGKALFQARYLSDSGRLFFNSHDALVAADTNGVGDVYEYEPTGVGDCAPTATGFVASAAGCLGLISSGSSPSESAFLEASATGSDVFFLTAAKLWTNDLDSSLDVYDARECTTSSPCVSAPATPAAACEGESCQAPVSPPIESTPASLTFSGVGNISAPPGGKAPVKVKQLTRAQKFAHAMRTCARGAKRKRAACERRARRAYGPEKGAKGSSAKGVRG